MGRGPTTRAARQARSEAANNWTEFDHTPRHEPKRHLTDEELLLVAVLHRGLLDYAQVMHARAHGRRPKGDLASHETAVETQRYWVWSDAEPEWPLRPSEAPYFFELKGAEEWVESRSKEPFSFEYCCWQGLGQDPEFIRATVRTHWTRLLTGEAATIFATYTPRKDSDDADL